MTANQPQLHNNRNVYIIGAGFSADAGLPLLGNFMNRMKDGLPWLETQGWTKEVESIRNLLRFRQESAGAAYRVLVNVENIEDLFSLAAATDNDRLSADLIRAIAGTLAFADKTASPKIVPLQVPEGFLAPSSWKLVAPNAYNIHIYDYYLAVMTGHFSGCPAADNTFITFNYDTVVESAARRLGVSYEYGFAGQRMRYEPAAAYSPNMGPGFRLLKIHGSVSWAYPGKRGQKLTHFDSYDDVRQEGLVPLLVPPTWKKGGDKRIEDAWSAAVSAIEQATRVFIVGCSLPTTDVHFRYLLAAGLRNNISLRKVWFANPAANEKAIQQRVMSIFPDSLRDQGVLDFYPADLSQLCQSGLLNRPWPAGFRAW